MDSDGISCTTPQPKPNQGKDMQNVLSTEINHSVQNMSDGETYKLLKHNNRPTKNYIFSAILGRCNRATGFKCLEK